MNHYQNLFLKYQVNTGFIYFLEVLGDKIYSKKYNEHGTLIHKTIHDNKKSKIIDDKLEKYKNKIEYK